MDRASGIPPHLMRFPETLLLPGEDRRIPLTPKALWKLFLQTKKALSHLQMETVLIGMSNFHHHPKRMSLILFLLMRAQTMFPLFKRERILPLVPNRSPRFCFPSYGDSYLHQLQNGVPHHPLLAKEITDVLYVKQRTWHLLSLV